KYYDGHILDELSRRPLEDKDSLFYEHYLREEGFSNSTLTDSNLTLVGEWPWGLCRAVAVQGNYAFIGNGKLVQTLDISNPDSPRVVAEYNTGYTVKDIELDDTLAFVCASGLKILCISDPLDIKFISEVPNTLFATEVIPADSFAYVLESGDPRSVNVSEGKFQSDTEKSSQLPSRFDLIDISDIKNPYLRSAAGIYADFPLRMAASNGVIYITGVNFPFLTIVDVRKPDSVSSRYFTIASYSIAIRDTLLFLSHGWELAVLSISNPLEPVLLDTAYAGINKIFKSIVVSSGNYVYASNDSGLLVFDISDPSNTSFVKRFKAPKARKMKLEEDKNRIHIAATSQYAIVNIMGADTAYLAGSFIAGGIPYDIAIQGNYAYIASGRPGLTILDLSNPTAPSRVGVLDFGKASFTLAVKDNHAYVGAEGLWSIDISNPQMPATTSYIPSTSYWFTDIYVDNNRIYTLDTSVTIYNISNMAEPVVMGNIVVPYSSYRISAKDSILYVVAQDSGLILFNTADPSNIFESSRIYCWPMGILVADSLAFVATLTGLQVFNISNPSQPDSIGFVATGGTRGGIINLAYKQNYVYMNYSSLFTIDVANPYIPQVVGFYGGGGAQIASYKEYIYVCLDLYLRYIRDELITSVKEKDNTTTSFQLLQNYPNPFNLTTKIAYTLPASAFTTLKIYNFIGEEIATLREERQNAGCYEFIWNSEGLPSGLYFVRLTSEYFIQTRKLLLIR
ncbi:MAG: T9SS type A sorting domain-containing protein, partial [Bacteroidota bacterium]|nr:T9SS type A sorting domain-containing protein [Bacteroidota bacterium]